MKTHTISVSKWAGFLIVIFLALKLSSCCEEPPEATSAGLPIRFINKSTGNAIYNLTKPIFPRDSLKVFDLGKKISMPISLLSSGDLTIDSIYEPDKDQASYDAEICKSFVVQFFENDSGVIEICYMLSPTKCDGSEFKFIEAKWNNKLIHTANGGVYHPIIINM